MARTRTQRQANGQRAAIYARVSDKSQAEDDKTSLSEQIGDMEAHCEDKGMIRERILTEETIVELVTLVAEEIDAMAGELSGRLEVIEAELGDVRKRLERLYEALETSELTLEVLSPRIFSLRHREEQLEAAREDAETQLEQRRIELPTTEEIKGYVADFREFLQEGTFPERKAPHPQLRGGHRGGGRRGDADVHHTPFTIDTKNCGTHGQWG